VSAASGPAAVHATAVCRLRGCSVSARQALSESGPAWGLRRTECLADWLNSGYLM